MMAQAQDSATQHDPREIEELPSSVNVYQYSNMDDFCRVISCERTSLYSSFAATQGDDKGRPDNLMRQTETEGTQTDHIIFIIDPMNFAHDFLDSLTDRPFHDRISFNPNNHLLVVRMPVPAHEQAAEAFGEILKSALPERCLRVISLWRSTTLTAEDGTSKEADGGWGPLRPPRGAPTRPSVILEVASSETPGKLRRDAHYWVDPARGQANIAFTIRAHTQRPQITIEQWEWDRKVCRPIRKTDLTITKSGSDGQIYFNPDQPRPQLLIPFHLLFRRPADNPSERDLVLGTEDLVEFAISVWNQQF